MEEKRFVDTDIFIYAMQGHPEFGTVARRILERIDREEAAVTSHMNISEVCSWLEKNGMAGEIGEKIKLIRSIFYLEIATLEMGDFVEASRLIKKYGLDFNDCITLALMKRMNIDTIYSTNTDFDITRIKRVFE